MANNLLVDWLNKKPNLQKSVQSTVNNNTASNAKNVTTPQLKTGGINLQKAATPVQNTTPVQATTPLSTSNVQSTIQSNNPAFNNWALITPQNQPSRFIGMQQQPTAIQPVWYETQKQWLSWNKLMNNGYYYVPSSVSQANAYNQWEETRFRNMSDAFYDLQADIYKRGKILSDYEIQQKYPEFKNLDKDVLKELQNELLPIVSNWMWVDAEQLSQFYPELLKGKELKDVEGLKTKVEKGDKNIQNLFNNVDFALKNNWQTYSAEWMKFLQDVNSLKTALDEVKKQWVLGGATDYEILAKMVENSPELQEVVKGLSDYDLSSLDKAKLWRSDSNKILKEGVGLAQWLINTINTASNKKKEQASPEEVETWIRAKEKLEADLWGNTVKKIATELWVSVDSIDKALYRAYKDAENLGIKLAKYIVDKWGKEYLEKKFWVELTDEQYQEVMAGTDKYVEEETSKNKQYVLDYMESLNKEYENKKEKNLDPDIESFYNNSSKSITRMLLNQDWNGVLYKTSWEAAQNADMVVITTAWIVAPEVVLPVMMADSYARESQESFEELMEVQKKMGIPQDEAYDNAKRGSIIVWIASSAVEVYLEKLLGWVETTASKAFHDLLMKDFTERATKMVADRGLVELLKQWAVTQFKASLEEWLEEVVQQAIHNGALKQYDPDQKITEGMLEAFEWGFYNWMNLMAWGWDILSNIDVNAMNESAYNAGVKTRQIVDSAKESLNQWAFNAGQFLWNMTEDFKNNVTSKNVKGNTKIQWEGTQTTSETNNKWNTSLTVQNNKMKATDEAIEVQDEEGTKKNTSMKESGLTDKVLENLNWLDDNTRERIKKNPYAVEESKNLIEEMEENPWIDFGEYQNGRYEDVLNEILNKLEQKENKRKNDIWSLYDKLEESNVQIDETALKSKVAEFEAQAEALWDIITPAEQWQIKTILKNIQEIWDGTMDIWKVRKIADKWTKWSLNSSYDWIGLIRDIRDEIDNVIREQNPDMKEVDKAYRQVLNEISEIKWKLFYKKGWQVKSNAVSTVKNMLNAGNRLDLKNLEKYLPWITDKLQAIRDSKFVYNAYTTWKGSRFISWIARGVFGNIWKALWFVGFGWGWLLWWAVIDAAIDKAMINLTRTALKKTITQETDASKAELEKINKKIQEWKDLDAKDKARLKELGKKIEKNAKELSEKNGKKREWSRFIQDLEENVTPQTTEEEQEKNKVTAKKTKATQKKNNNNKESDSSTTEEWGTPKNTNPTNTNPTTKWEETTKKEEKKSEPKKKNEVTKTQPIEPTPWLAVLTKEDVRWFTEQEIKEEEWTVTDFDESKLTADEKKTYDIVREKWYTFEKYIDFPNAIMKLWRKTYVIKNNNTWKIYEIMGGLDYNGYISVEYNPLQWEMTKGKDVGKILDEINELTKWEQPKNAVTKKPAKRKQTAVEKFREETAKYEPDYEGIESGARSLAEQILEDADVDAEIVDLVFTWSKSRWLGHDTSDNDILIEIKPRNWAELREDNLFNLLNDEEWNGGEYDFNPILADDSWTLEEVVQKQEKYMKQKRDVKDALDSVGVKWTKDVADDAWMLENPDMLINFIKRTEWPIRFETHWETQTAWAKEIWGDNHFYIWVDGGMQPAMDRLLHEVAKIRWEEKTADTPKNKVTSKKSEVTAPKETKTVAKTEEKSDLRSKIGDKFYEYMQKQVELTNKSRGGMKEVTMEELLPQYIDQFEKMAQEEVKEIQDELNELTKDRPQAKMTEAQREQLNGITDQNERNKLLKKWQDEWIKSHPISDEDAAKVWELMDRAAEVVEGHKKARNYLYELEEAQENQENEDHFSYDTYWDIQKRIEEAENKINEEFDKQFEEEYDKKKARFDELNADDNTDRSDWSEIAKLANDLNNMRNKYDKLKEDAFNERYPDLIAEKKKQEELFNKDWKKTYRRAVWNLENGNTAKNKVTNNAKNKVTNAAKAKTESLFNEKEVDKGKQSEWLNPDAMPLSDLKEMQRLGFNGYNSLWSALRKEDLKDYMASRIANELVWHYDEIYEDESEEWIERDEKWQTVYSDVDDMYEAYEEYLDMKNGTDTFDENTIKNTLEGANDYANRVFKWKTAKEIIDEYTPKYKSDLELYNRLSRAYPIDTRGNINLNELGKQGQALRELANQDNETAQDIDYQELAELDNETAQIPTIFEEDLEEMNLRDLDENETPQRVDVDEWVDISTQLVDEFNNLEVWGTKWIWDGYQVGVRKTFGDANIKIPWKEESIDVMFMPKDSWDTMHINLHDTSNEGIRNTNEVLNKLDIPYRIWSEFDEKLNETRYYLENKLTHSKTYFENNWTSWLNVNKQLRGKEIVPRMNAEQRAAYDEAVAKRNAEIEAERERARQEEEEKKAEEARQLEEENKRKANLIEYVDSVYWDDKLQRGRILKALWEKNEESKNGIRFYDDDKFENADVWEVLDYLATKDGKFHETWEYGDTYSNTYEFFNNELGRNENIHHITKTQKDYLEYRMNNQPSQNKTKTEITGEKNAVTAKPVETSKPKNLVTSKSKVDEIIEDSNWKELKFEDDGVVKTISYEKDWVTYAYNVNNAELEELFNKWAIKNVDEYGDRERARQKALEDVQKVWDEIDEREKSKPKDLVTNPRQEENKTTEGGASSKGIQEITKDEYFDNIFKNRKDHLGEMFFYKDWYSYYPIYILSSWKAIAPENTYWWEVSTEEAARNWLLSQAEEHSEENEVKKAERLKGLVEKTAKKYEDTLKRIESDNLMKEIWVSGDYFKYWLKESQMAKAKKESEANAHVGTFKKEVIKWKEWYRIYVAWTKNQALWAFYEPETWKTYKIYRWPTLDDSVSYTTAQIDRIEKFLHNVDAQLDMEQKVEKVEKKDVLTQEWLDSLKPDKDGVIELDYKVDWDKRRALEQWKEPLVKEWKADGKYLYNYSSGTPQYSAFYIKDWKVYEGRKGLQDQYMKTKQEAVDWLNEKEKDVEHESTPRYEETDYETLPKTISVEEEAEKAWPKRIAPDRVKRQQETYDEGLNNVKDILKQSPVKIYELGFKSDRSKAAQDMLAERRRIRELPESEAEVQWNELARGIYEDLVVKDISKWYRYPEDVTSKFPKAQMKKAVDARARYEKWLFTSFSSKDTRANYQYRDEIWAWIKSQDWKPVTQAQMEEIVEWVRSFGKVFGLDMKKFAEDNGIIYIIGLRK